MRLRTILAAALALVLGTALVAPASAQSNAVVTADWLEKNLTNPKVRVVEVSVEPGLFERGHIPGAQNIVWHTDLVDTVKRDIATRENFQKLVQRLGLDKDTTTVLYGDNNNWFAAWGVWVFSMYGVDNVKLLDGGRKKWEADKRPYTTKVDTVPPGKLTIAAQNTKLRARLTDVLDAVNKKTNAAIVDIRGPDEFSGKIFAPPGVQELAVRAGHVPTAVNVPWGRAVNEDGTIKSADELRKLYAGVGVDGKRPVIVYCRIGERSSHTWFVLTYLLGLNNVRNYDGSWTEWGNKVGAPIEKST